MGKRREWWRQRDEVGIGAGESNAHKPAVKFRSDNDLYEWRFFWPYASAITALSASALIGLHIPFAYSPVAVLPAAVSFLFIRFWSIRSRKAGKRFSSYDVDDF